MEVLVVPLITTCVAGLDLHDNRGWAIVITIGYMLCMALLLAHSYRTQPVCPTSNMIYIIFDVIV